MTGQRDELALLLLQNGIATLCEPKGSVVCGMQSRIQSVPPPTLAISEKHGIACGYDKFGCASQYPDQDAG